MLDLIKRVKQRGVAVVLISHNIPHVFEITDRIFVMRLGRAAGNLGHPRDYGQRSRQPDHGRASHKRCAQETEMRANFVDWRGNPRGRRIARS